MGNIISRSPQRLQSLRTDSTNPLVHEYITTINVGVPGTYQIYAMLRSDSKESVIRHEKDVVVGHGLNDTDIRLLSVSASGNIAGYDNFDLVFDVNNAARERNAEVFIGWISEERFKQTETVDIRADNFFNVLDGYVPPIRLNSQRFTLVSSGNDSTRYSYRATLPENTPGDLRVFVLLKAGDVTTPSRSALVTLPTSPIVPLEIGRYHMLVSGTNRRYVASDGTFHADITRLGRLVSETPYDSSIYNRVTAEPFDLSGVELMVGAYPPGNHDNAVRLTPQQFEVVIGNRLFINLAEIQPSLTQSGRFAIAIPFEDMTAILGENPNPAQSRFEWVVHRSGYPANALTVARGQSFRYNGNGNWQVFGGENVRFSDGDSLRGRPNLVHYTVNVNSGSYDPKDHVEFYVHAAVGETVVIFSGDDGQLYYIVVIVEYVN
jgi:hypothetical protein